jgi:hypothetical protein
MTQYKRYVEAYKDMKGDVVNFAKLEKDEKIGSYMKPARKYSNMLYEYEKDMNTYEFSVKLPQLLQTIRAYPEEKHYAYSAFYENRGYGGQGVLAIAQFLESQEGYTRLTVAEAVKLNKAGTLPAAKKRYFLATTTELKYGKLSMGECLRQLLLIFNHADNKNGELVHVMLASNQFNEGVDLKAVRHIHIFEPLLSTNKEIQTIGRAARYCSHKDLNRGKNEWTVTVHRYLSEFPGQIQIMDIAGHKNQLAAIGDEVSGLDAELAGMKGQRGPEAKQRRDELKEELVNKKGAMKTLQKEIKEMEEIDPSKVKMVDPLIVNEVRERFKNIGLMLKAMKSASVDCRLFQAFHNWNLTPENKFICM